MEFENTTQYDKRAVSALVNVVIHVTQRQIYSQRRTALLCLGILTASVGGVLLCTSGLLFRIFGGLAAVLGAAILLEFLFLRQNTVRSVRRRLPGGERVFRFTPEGIQAEHPGAGQTRYRYSQVTEAFDSGGCFVLLLKDGGSLMVARDGFTTGTAEDFRAFLEEKVKRPVRQVR